MTTAADRDLILRRVRAALRDVPAGEAPEDVDVPRAYSQPTGDPGSTDLFAERAADYRATVIRTTRADLPRAIAIRLAERNISALVLPPGLPAAYLSDPSAQACTLLPDDPPLSTAQLDAADGVITGARLAIAQTGTIVLDAGPGQGRRALTLLPDYHLCVVRADQIAADVPAALRLLDPAAPLTFISGPSATSDIENTRVEGVHGPRTLDIVIVDPDQEGK